MAQVHVLEYADGRFRCVIHTATPSGDNSANIPWATVFLATGRSGRTVLVEGTGPGQITAEEKAQIQAGRCWNLRCRLRRRIALRAHNSRHCFKHKHRGS